MHSAKTTSASGRIQRARSGLRTKPSAPAPSTVAAVPAKAWVSAASSTLAKDSMTGPRPRPLNRAGAGADQQGGGEQPAHGERADTEALAREGGHEQHPEAGEGADPRRAEGD